MQVQKIQTNQSFTGIKLQTVIAPAKKIDVYQLSEKDKDFIESLLNVIKGQKFPQDKLSIGEGSNRDIFEKSLRAASEKDGKTLIAIENNNKIAGVLNLHNNADNELAGLTCMNGTKQPDAQVRESLILAAMKETEKLKDAAIVVKAKEFSSSVSKLLRKFGFKTETTPRGKEMYIECQDIQRAIDKYGYKSENQIFQYNKGRDISLNKLFGADK